MTREELMSQARKHMWAAWALSSEELASQAADTLIGLGMLVPEGGAAELERLRREVESSCVDGARLIRAEQRTAELEAVLGTHRKDDQAVIERLRARIAALEAEVAEYEQPADEDPIAYVLTEKADEASGYPPALPWAALMDGGDLTDFLDELAASAITHASSEVALAEVEKTCATWRLIAEAQHAHNTAPGPDAMTRLIAPVQALREDDGYESPLHHDYLVGHDLPETGGSA